MFRVASLTILLLLFGLPVVALGAASDAVAGNAGLTLALRAASPFLYVAAYVLVAGLLSLPFQSAVVPGRFPRDLADPRYRARRLYGLCWTSVYYFKPVYFVCLSVPWLKWMLFRLFGYRGTMDFTVYPDTWIRDLPLLEFGPGAYVANRATLGTNMALQNGTLAVDRIRVGAGATVGHLAMLSPGVVLDEGSEVGAGSCVGSKCVLHKGASLSACSAMGHWAEIGEGAKVGFMSSLGMASRVGAGMKLAPLTVVPNREKIERVEDAARMFSSADGDLSRLAGRLAAIRDHRGDAADHGEGRAGNGCANGHTENAAARRRAPAADGTPPRAVFE